MTTSEVCDLKW